MSQGVDFILAPSEVISSGSPGTWTETLPGAKSLGLAQVVVGWGRLARISWRSLCTSGPTSPLAIKPDVHAALVSAVHCNSP